MLVSPKVIQTDWENKADVFESKVLKWGTKILKLKAEGKLNKSIQYKIKLLLIKRAGLRFVILS